MLVVAVLAVFASATSATEADGCTSCHANTATIAVHAALLPKHASATCVACHRGNGTSRDKTAAHANGPDELLAKERTGAACVVCHIAGSVAGTEAIVTGGRAYLSRGCNFCHLGAKGLGYAGVFAPPLFAIGGRGSAYLTQMLHEPKKIFPATVMPAYHLPEGEERALLAYLISLRGDFVPPAQPALSKQTCTSCHSAKAAGGKPHRCTWIKEESATLACKSCHKKDLPTGTAECMYIRERRKECGICHEGGIDGR